jgi:hypothetical protein
MGSLKNRVCSVEDYWDLRPINETPLCSRSDTDAEEIVRVARTMP